MVMKSFPAACGGAGGLGVVRGHCKKWESVESQLPWGPVLVGEPKTEAPGGDSCCQDNIRPGGGRCAFTGAWRCLFPFVEPSIPQRPAENEGTLSTQGAPSHLVMMRKGQKSQPPCVLSRMAL